MKICFLIDDLRSGGAQRQLITLANRFCKDNYIVEIIFYYPHFYYRSFLNEHNIKHTYLPSKGARQRIKSVKAHLIREKPDVVIAFMGVPSLIAELASFPFKPWKLLVGERSSDPKIFNSIKSRIIRFFHLRADFVVGNSNTNLSIVKKVNPILSQKRLKLIYNGINLKHYKPDKNFLFKKNDQVRIIVPASYRRLKNPLGLIQAVYQLPQEYQDKLFIDWFGDKSYDSHQDNVLKECEQLIEQYRLGGIFQLRGLSAEIFRLIPQYDAVGLFSFYEGLPNSVCEGMACGKPIICSTVSDLPVLLTEAKNAFMFNPKNISELKAALINLVKSSSRELLQMGLENRALAEQLFDEDKMFEQYEKLIHV